MAEITEKEIESGKLQALVLIEKKPQNIFDESAVFADVIVASLGRKELSAVHLVDIIAHLHRLSCRMPCGHPRECIVSGDGGTAHCAWCEEVARRRGDGGPVRRYIVQSGGGISARFLPGDIPALVAETERLGAEVARLREALAKQIQRRRLEVAAVLHARNEAEHKTFEWYEECQSEVERLRGELERLRGDDGHPRGCIAMVDLAAIEARCEAATRGPWYIVRPPWRAAYKGEFTDTCIVAGNLDPHVGVAIIGSIMIEEWDAELLGPDHSQSDADLNFCAHARTDVPILVNEVARLREALEQRQLSTDGTAAYMEMEAELHTDQLRDEVERLKREVTLLRELIPDMGMLNWLVKAAHRWWKDNGGEGTQKDIAAGYALVKKLCREANIDGT